MSNHIIHKTAKISKTAKIIGKGKISIGAYVTIEDNVTLNTGNNLNSLIKISNRSKIKQGTLLEAYNGFIHIGNRSTISSYCCIAGHGRVTIGSCVIIANHTTIHASTHIYLEVNI